VNRHGIMRVLPVALVARSGELEASDEAVRGHIASLFQTIPI
jgi:hypothetical protein